MQYTRKLKDSVLEIEVLTNSQDILKAKKKYLFDEFKDSGNLQDIFKGLKSGDINHFISARLVNNNGDLIYDSNGLYYSDSIEEFLEFSIEELQRVEFYEACSFVRKLIDNKIV